MTIRAVAGLLAYNAFLLSIGVALLYALRGWRFWSDLVRLGGVAYLLGVAATTVVLTLELVLGVPFGLPTLLLSGGALAAASLAVGRARGQPWPAFRPAGWRLRAPTLPGALLAAAIGVYLMALFRSSRLAPLFEWDAWQVWTHRAKVLVYFDGLNPELVFFPSYPPGVSILQAGAFEAMGSVDVVTLHLQWWFLVVGAVAAIGGLLAPRVRPLVLMPVLLLLLVMPGFVERATYDVMADLPLGYLLTGAALLLVLWLDERRGWQLASAVVLLGGAQLAKREGVLLAACVVLAAFVATWGDRRAAWRPLGLAAAAAFALAVPWRIWFRLQGLPNDGPESGYLDSLTLVDRMWPALELVLTTLVDYELWLALPVLAVAASGLALAAGSRRTPLFALAFAGLALFAMSWSIWSNPSFAFSQDPTASPVVRLTGTAVLVLGALTPLLLAQAWSGGRRPYRAVSHEPRSGRRRAALAWATLLVPLLAYPGSMLAGVSSFRLPGGPPSFPSASDCVRELDDGEIRVVFGYADSYPEANALRAETAAIGYRRTEVAPDGCGRLRVFLDGVSSVEEGRRILTQARRESGLEPALERDPLPGAATLDRP